MLHEGIAVGAVNKWDVEGFGIGQRLLHAGADRVRVVLGLDQSDGEVGFVI